MHKEDNTIELNSFVVNANLFENDLNSDSTEISLKSMSSESSLGSYSNLEQIFTTAFCKSQKTQDRYIARGSYASVYRLTPEFSMKVCNPSSFNLLDVTSELFILTQLSHPSILSCNFVTRISRSIAFVMPYYGNTLETLYPRTESQKMNVVRQLASAVNYLHSKKILHLDICPKNILVKQIGEEFKVVLCDFSLSTVVTTDVIVSHGPRITTDHRPYENLRGSKRYTYKSDIWSLGVVFYKVMTETYLFKLATVPVEHPISSDYILAVLFEIEQLQSWGRWPPSEHNYICRMLELDISQRIDSYELCNMLQIDTFEPQRLVSSKMTMDEKWLYVSDFFKKIDTVSLTQIELLFTDVMKYYTENLIPVSVDESNEIFLCCYAVVKSCTVDIAHLNIQNASSLFARVFDIFVASKGKILRYQE